MKSLRNLRMVLAVVALVMAAPALAPAQPITINWWHAHGGVLVRR